MGLTAFNFVIDELNELKKWTVAGYLGIPLCNQWPFILTLDSSQNLVKCLNLINTADENVNVKTVIQ